MKWSGYSKIGLALLGVVTGFLVSGEVVVADFIFGNPTNLGSPVNSEANESGPCISSDGLEFYFDSDRPGGLGDPNTDIWVSTRKTVNDSWDEPVNLNSKLVDPNNPVNTKYNEAQPSISADGLSLYFHSTRPGNSWYVIGWGPNGPSNIWVTRRKTKEDPWGKPENIYPFVNTNCDEWDPSISDEALFFTRNLFGKVGIWMSTWDTGNWYGVPLLEPINSNAIDSMPSISRDGLVLFFASTRAGGYGHYDLYVTTRPNLSAPWTEPKNLGPTVNTLYAESAPCLSADGRVLYFSDWNKVRPGGLGGYDLWQVQILHCGDEGHPYPEGDLNRDCRVDLSDLAVLCSHWLDCTGSGCD